MFKAKIFQNYRENECGATAIEYGLIAALIAVSLIGGATVFSDSLNGMFTDVDGEVSQAFDK